MKKIVLSSALILALCLSVNTAFAGGRDNRCGHGRSSHYGGSTFRFSYGPSHGFSGSHFNYGPSYGHKGRSCDRSCNRSCYRPSPAFRSQNNRYDYDRYGNRVIARNERGYWTQGEFYHHGYYKPPVYHPYERDDRRRP